MEALFDRHGHFDRSRRAGHGEDAQQRALIHVEQAGEVRWLAASQSGLRLAEGDEVQLSWASKRPESCYVHGVLAHR